MGFRIAYKNKARAGSIGDGDGDGGGGEGTTATASTRPSVAPSPPSLDRVALPVSPLPPEPEPEPPRPPADKDADNEKDDDDCGKEEDDDEDDNDDDEEWDEENMDPVEDDWDEESMDKVEDDWDEESMDKMEDDQNLERNKPRRSPDNSFRAIMISAQRDIPHYIARHDSMPLNKNEYFSLRTKWNQLLDGKRTYLRPPRNRRTLIDVFQCPNAPRRALGCQEPLMDLIHDFQRKYIILDKIKILSQHYLFFRQTRQDGSCFYRALLFSYLENLGQMQDSQAEVTRLMICVAKSKAKLRRLKWDNAYFLNPEEYFSSVISDLYCLVNSVANGLNTEELYKRSLQEIMSTRIISLLRLMTEIEIRCQEGYIRCATQGMNAHKLCLETVRPLHAEASCLQFRACTYALGIPVRVEMLDTNLSAGGGEAKVRYFDFFPRTEGPGKENLHMNEGYHSPGTGTAAELLPERGSGGGCGSLLSPDGTPLLVLLWRLHRCDILYRGR